jgi:uncharacterized protein YndB with AHSA1/START domain
MNTITQHGYLVLADISGYTSYLAGVELDHAHEILTDLLEVIVGRVKTLLTIGKLEGDAVFAYAAESQITRGEILLELIESTYIAFRDRINASIRHTTCECRACQGMKSLDLKFIVHHGDYFIQNVMGIHELVGSDVNLAHRLMKNHIGQDTGWCAYVLLTENCLEHLNLKLTQLREQAEEYEHLGSTKTYCYDLHPRYLDELKLRQIMVTKDDAMVVLSRIYPASPAVVWDWLNDPRKRAQYGGQKGLVFQPILTRNGRRGVGATTHCIHGDHIAMKETVLDWRPFDYFTVLQDSGSLLGAITTTFQLESAGENKTNLTIYIKGQVFPGFLNRVFVWLIYDRIFYSLLMKKLGIVLADIQPPVSLEPAASVTT